MRKPESVLGFASVLSIKLSRVPGLLEHLIA